ncbi:MAG: hypothetical protein GY822_11890, partial [Deltaproteobacteria bacterium]|nr:hypothetical protein [Deltaproteobacteria bacterium]
MSSVFEWACLIPAAIAVDYTAAHHGNQSSFIWQATIALIFAKLYREIVKYTGIVGAIGLGLVGVGMIAPTLLAGFAPG